MTSTFHGLEVARRGIHAQQKAIQTTNHNIANANTPGYTRQRVDMSATSPIEAPGINRSTHAGQLGTGVEAGSIERIREQFLDDQFRNEASSFGSWDVQKDTLEKIEMIFNEPGNDGLSSVIDDFWNAWQDLSQEPDNMTERAVVRERAQAMIDAFQHTDTKLNELQSDLTTNMNAKMEEANLKLEQIDHLNNEIHRIETLGDNANDLRDNRDLLVDELAALIPVHVQENADTGVYEISVPMEDTDGGEEADQFQLVGGEALYQLGQQINDDGELEFVVQDEDGAVFEDEDNGGEPFTVDISSGELHGLSVAHDQIVPDYQAHVHSMLSGLIEGEVDVEIPGNSVLPGDGVEANGIETEDLEEDENGNYVVPEEGITVTVNGINGLHQLGWTMDEDNDGDAQSGEPFFQWGEEGDDFSIQDVEINPDIANDSGSIASSMRVEEIDGNLTVLHGNGDLALAMGKLRDQTFDFQSDIVSDGRGSFDEYFRSVIGELGVQTQEATRQANNQESIMDSVENRRQSVSGVSLDEEMSNLVQFQHAYNASARSLTTMDEMLDTLINRMGVVGR